MVRDGLVVVEGFGVGWRSTRRLRLTGGILLEVTDDAVDDLGVGEHRDDLHFGATFATEQRVNFEDLSDESCPRSAAG